MSGSIAGYNGVLFVSPDSGTTWHAVGELKDVQFKRTAKMLDATTHASAGDEDFIPGNRGWTATASYLAVYSDAGQTDIAAALTPGTKLKARFDPVGTAVGKPRREGFCFIEDFTEKAPTSDIVAVDITLRGAGALTLSTQ
jgi:predicted secreted protein